MYLLGLSISQVRELISEQLLLVLHAERNSLQVLQEAAEIVTECIQVLAAELHVGEELVVEFGRGLQRRCLHGLN